MIEHSRETLLDGRYQLLEKLGAGATGVVFKGCDLQLDHQTVAIKILYPHLVQGAASIAQFKREVLITQRLSHPCIVQTYRFLQTAEGNAALVMEHVEGDSLRSRLENHPQGLPVDELIGILFAVACGLDFSHSLGVLHRDLKPDNILVAAGGIAKIADFGLAQNLRGGDQLRQGTVGTPYYMAPELFHGAVSDASSDVYSFGVMAFELASGRLPYRSQSLFELAVAHREAALPALDQERPELPRWLCELIGRCCGKTRSARPSLTQIIATVEEHAKATVADLARLHTTRSEIDAAAPGVHATRRTPVRSHPFILLFLILLLLALLGLVIIPRTFTSVTWRHAAAVGRMEYYLGVRLPFLYRAMGINEDIHNPELSLRMSRITVFVPLFAGVDPNYRASDGKQSLQRIAAMGRSATFQDQAVDYLLEFGADVNGTDSAGRTGLWYASEEGNIRVAERLLAARADPQLGDSDGVTPLHRALAQRETGIVFLLLRHGASVTKADVRGETPIHIAARQCNELMLKAMLTKSAIVELTKSRPGVKQELLEELVGCREGEEARGRSEAIISARFSDGSL